MRNQQYGRNIQQRGMGVKGGVEQALISGDRKIPLPKEDPEAREFALRGLSLRETHKNSNYILLRIPVKIHLFQRGLQGICMDSHRLPEILGLSDQDIERLCHAGLVRL